MTSDEKLIILDEFVENIRKLVNDPVGDFYEIFIRKAKLDPACDFKFADLSGVDFGNIDISGFDFSDSDISGGNLSKVSGLNDAIFTRAKMNGVVLPAYISSDIEPNIGVILRAKYGIELPPPLEQDVVRLVKARYKSAIKNIGPADIFAVLEQEFIGACDPINHRIGGASHLLSNSDAFMIKSTFFVDGIQCVVSGAGDSPISAYMNALEEIVQGSFYISAMIEQEIEISGESARIAYAEGCFGGEYYLWGVGISSNIIDAQIFAVNSLINRIASYKSAHIGNRVRALAHKPNFEIVKDKAGEYRVRFKYNAETMFSTEGYSSKAAAQNAIDSIKKNGPGAPVEDNS